MGGKKVNKTPWKNGVYRMKSMPDLLFTVDGENVSCEYMSGRTTSHDKDANFHGSFKFGNFGKANPKVAKEGGKEHYNVNIDLWNGVFPPKGVICEDGTKICFWGMENSVDCLEWESEESIMAIREKGDPAEIPPCTIS